MHSNVNQHLTTNSRLTADKPESKSPLTLKLPARLDSDLSQQHELNREKFQDNGSDYCDPHEYSRPGNDQGLVIIFGNDEQIEVMDLIESLAKPFVNKPKMFIIQACKGTVEEMLEIEAAELIYPIYNLPSDTIIYYATVEGNLSIREVSDGSWLISQLCKNFLMYGRREDIVSLLQRTIKCISLLETDKETDKIYYKQMPVIVSTLQKKFYLSSNKYRENMYITKSNIKEAANSLNKLVQQFK